MYEVDSEWCEGSSGIVPDTPHHLHRHQITPQGGFGSRTWGAPCTGWAGAAERGYTANRARNDYWRWVYGAQQIQIGPLRLSIFSIRPILTPGETKLEISPRKCVHCVGLVDFEVQTLHVLDITLKYRRILTIDDSKHFFLSPLRAHTDRFCRNRARISDNRIS